MAKNYADGLPVNMTLSRNTDPSNCKVIHRIDEEDQKDYVLVGCAHGIDFYECFRRASLYNEYLFGIVEAFIAKKSNKRGQVLFVRFYASKK